MDGVGKALAIARRIGKATPKVVGYSLPLLSVGVKALSSYTQANGDIEGAGRIFLESYIPINTQTGEFYTRHLMSGLGALLVSLGVGKIITSLA